MIKSELKYDNFFQEELESPKKQNSNLLQSSSLPSKVPKNMQLKCRKMNNITLDDLPVNIKYFLSVIYHKNLSTDTI